MSDKIIYEQPLNERIRTFLRLEFLFRQARHCLRGQQEWDSRCMLASLLAILNLISGKTDLKTEILKELERQTAYLATLERNPDVDRSLLSEILDQLESLIDRLHAFRGQLGQELRDNELLTSIRQRSAIPGGDCDFDIPAYHFWLQGPAEQRQVDLNQWMSSLSLVEEAIELILKLIRQSAVPKPVTAQDGFFQMSLDKNTPCQLVRISLPGNSACFPEVSGGKHRVTIRFMAQTDPRQRPAQVAHDVDFGLTCCNVI